MEEAFSAEALKQRVAESELGREFLQAPLMEKDVWPVTALGYTEEEARIRTVQNIHFQDFSLEWLKLLTKLTVKASVREKHSLETIIQRNVYLKQLDKFLSSKGDNTPETLTNSLCQEFVNQGNRKNRGFVIGYAINLWAEERWLKITFIPLKDKPTTPKIEIIPEEVLLQIYEKFDLLPPPLERLFRLQFVLGWRIGEILRLPRQCLKQENGQYFLKKWVEKRQHWEFIAIHLLVAELIQEQQRFLNTQFGCNSDFDKLFCKISAAHHYGFRHDISTRFDVTPRYLPEVLSNQTISKWLRSFSEIADLKDKYSHRFNLTSHQFRRTKFSIMAYCETGR